MVSCSMCTTILFIHYNLNVVEVMSKSFLCFYVHLYVGVGSE